MKPTLIPSAILIMLSCTSCESTYPASGSASSPPRQYSGQSNLQTASPPLSNQSSSAAEAAFARTEYGSEHKRDFIEGFNDARAGRANRVFPNGKPTGQGADPGFLAEDESAYVDGYEAAR